MKNIMHSINELKGTASELAENRAFDELSDLVGEAGALKALKPMLEERGLTEDQWNAYRQVRKVMHARPLGVRKTVKEVKDLVDACTE